MATDCTRKIYRLLKKFLYQRQGWTHYRSLNSEEDNSLLMSNIAENLRVKAVFRLSTRQHGQEVAGGQYRHIVAT